MLWTLVAEIFYALMFWVEKLFSTSMMAVVFSLNILWIWFLTVVYSSITMRITHLVCGGSLLWLPICDYIQRASIVSYLLVNLVIVIKWLQLAKKLFNSSNLNFFFIFFWRMQYNFKHWLFLDAKPRCLIHINKPTGSSVQALYVHIPARHSSSFPELELPTLLQVCIILLVSFYSHSKFCTNSYFNLDEFILFLVLEEWSSIIC